MRIVYWNNAITHLQSANMVCLAAMPGIQLTWVVEEQITPDRIALGWTAPNTSGIHCVTSPSWDETRDILYADQSDSVHVFSGIFARPLLRKAFIESSKIKARIGILNEPPIAGSRLRNLAVPSIHTIHRLVYGRNVRFILAIGHMGVKFYHSIGYSPSIIYPFGYFPVLNTRRERVEIPTDDIYRFTFVGQLVKRKGIDILLSALARLDTDRWHVTLIGSGEENDSLASQVSELNIADRVTFQPAMDNVSAMKLLQSSDCLALPSRHDGWGAVVNEALLRGIPVVCSNRCGAADLINNDWRGMVFESESVESLRMALAKMIERGKRTQGSADRIIEWSKAISPQVAAEYSRDVILGTGKARALWLE